MGSVGTAPRLPVADLRLKAQDDLACLPAFPYQSAHVDCGLGNDEPKPALTFWQGSAVRQTAIACSIVP